MQYTKEIPVIKKTEVLVVGAGPAGIGAALASARHGSKTFLFDQNGCVGGMATIGMVGPFMTSFDANAENMVVRGIFEELVDDMVTAGKAVHPKDVHNGEPYSSFSVLDTTMLDLLVLNILSFFVQINY
ncbi:MAG: FAD-dependent oxidoreductase [Coriobacteriia bacterium]|nr:FAD-dependent oxidoreductase [Coriobacteriia bacterium]